MNPDFGDTLPQAIPTSSPGNFRRFRAPTPTSPRPTTYKRSPTRPASTSPSSSKVVRASTPRWRSGSPTGVLRILLSIGGSEIMHFQTWQDKAGNAPPLTDPTNGLIFPDLNADGEMFQTNLIMPEPTIFLEPQVPDLLDHPPHRDRRRRHGRAQRLDRRRTVHRSIAGVLCSPDPAGTGSGCGPTRRTRRQRHDENASMEESATRERQTTATKAAVATAASVRATWSQ